MTRSRDGRGGRWECLDLRLIMPRFGKILMRCTGARPPPDKGKIFEVLQRDLQLPLTGLKSVANGFNAFTEYETDIEKLLTQAAKQKLAELGLEV